MSKFYVGQRVKKVCEILPNRPGDPKIPIGSTGKITSLHGIKKGTPLRKGPALTNYDCTIIYDDYPDERYSRTDCLEPLYDGNEKISWEEMKELWMPEGMNV